MINIATVLFQGTTRLVNGEFEWEQIRVTVVNLITKQITPLIYSLSKIENIVGRNRS